MSDAGMIERRAMDKDTQDFRIRIEGLKWRLLALRQRAYDNGTAVLLTFDELAELAALTMPRELADAFVAAHAAGSKPRPRPAGSDVSEVPNGPQDAVARMVGGQKWVGEGADKLRESAQLLQSLVQQVHSGCYERPEAARWQALFACGVARALVDELLAGPLAAPERDARP